MRLELTTAKVNSDPKLNPEANSNPDPTQDDHLHPDHHKGRSPLMTPATHLADPRPLVLDIGTGSGLLSMCAARFQVRGVVTCERDAAMAEAAKQVLDANHLHERVEVINKSSKDLTLGYGEGQYDPDMDEKADVLVAEIFGDDPLNEGVIATLEHARANLLVPGALVVPCEIVVIAAVVESAALTRFCLAPRDAGGTGLDFRELSDLAKFRQYPRIKSYPYTQLTPPTEVCRIGLQGDDFETEGEFVAEVEATRAGEAQFVVFWYELVFPGGGVYSTSPEEEMHGRDGHKPWSRAWNQVSYGLHHEPGGLKRCGTGDMVRIKTEYRYDRLWFGVSTAPAAK